MLDEGAQGVTVSSHEHRLAVLKVGSNIRGEVRHHAGHDVFETLGDRTLGLRDVGVPRVMELAEFAVAVKVRWTNIVGATPSHELVVAVLLLGLSLVETLQRTVVTLVEAPGAMHRDPMAVAAVKG